MTSWDKLSRSEIQRIQDEKLHHFLNRYLYPFSPFYRTLFDEHKIDPRKIKASADLKYIPFTDKQSFTDRPDRFRDFVIQPDAEKIRKHWPKTWLIPLLLKKIFKGDAFVKERLGLEFRPIFLTATTGRTAAPISFLYTPHDLENLAKAGRRLAEVFGVSHEDRAVNIFPYAPHLAFWQVAFAGLDFKAMIVSTGGGKTLGTRGNLAVISKIRPQLIIGVPGYIYHLLRAAREEKMDLGFIQKIVLGAEKVPLGLKEKMAEFLVGMGAKDPRIIGTYGFTEARVAWGECPTPLGKSSGYHTYPDLEIFEVINPQTGEPVGEGEDGEVVYTAIDGRGSAVLRYRTGDYAKGGITWEPCPFCSRTVPRLSSDLTRVSNIKEFQLTKIKGTLVNLNVLAGILNDRKEVDEWQLEIRKKDNDPHEIDELILYLTPKPGVNIEALKRYVNQAFVAEAEVSPNEIVILGLDEMLKRLGMETEMKEKRFLDNRP